jgi:1-deoxy-D-xylulose-5-phosphate synthase
VELPEEPQLLPIGKAAVLKEDGQVALVALGNMNALAAQVQALLAEKGVECAHINARFIKPLDADCLKKFAQQCKLVVTLEDHTVVGGFGSAVTEFLSQENIATPVLRIGWGDSFVEHGTLELLREKHGLTPQAVAEKILTRLK